METEVKVGTYVEPENWTCGDLLEEGLPGFCDFYLPTHCGGPIKHVAVNVVITGHMPHRRLGTFYRRVRITFVGDGEPNTVTGGWILFYKD